MKKRKAKTTSKILKNFKGKFVSITMSEMRGRIGNVSFVGYLVDEDKDNFYLSETIDSAIKAAVPKAKHCGISIEDEIDFLMNNIDVPDNQGVQ